MAKIRKQKKRQHYNHGKNRKRMNKQNRPKTINCKVVKSVWNEKKSSQKNMKEMGLVFDVNKEDLSTIKPIKTEAVKKLEEVANAPRENGYRLPKNQIIQLTMLMDKFGDDYKAMAKDKSNILQHTWKQLRRKINVFKNIPEQYNLYLDSKQMVVG